MNGYSPLKVKKGGLQPVVGIVAAQAISKEFGMTAGGSLNMRVAIESSSVTVVGSIAVKLQQRSPSGAFVDLAGANATVAITADGSVSMQQNVQIAADQPNLPLQKTVRVVITTTNAGDRITVDNVWLLQAL